MIRRTLLAGLIIVSVALAASFSEPGRDVVSGIAYAVESGRADAAQDQLLKREPGDLEHAFELAAQAVQPSVVSITSVRRVAAGQAPPGLRGVPMVPFGDGFRGFFDGEPFERFFFFDNVPPGAPGKPGGGESFTQEGLGSGVLVDEQGHVLTNNHVVREADELTVRLTDGRTLPAKLVGADPRTDLAVIKVEQTSGLRPARLADSDGVKVGQWVMAVGSPLGLDQTVTAGIVSYKGRANLGIADFEDFIQTDAAINQGNSGGPLVNLRGEVVGINTAILSRSGGNQGIGLAIPSNMAKDVMGRLISDGKVVRGWLGVSIQELDEGLAASFGYNAGKQGQPGGVLVGEVVPDGPAKRAGVRTGDIITSMDGKPAGDVRAFRNRVAQLKPGTRVPFEVWRGGKTHKLEVEIGEAPQQQPALAGGGSAGQGGLAPFGLTLDDAPVQSRRQPSPYAEAAAGAVVVAVTPGSPAQRAGIEPGDLVIDVHGTAVRTADEARQAAAKLDAKNGLRLRVQRGDSTRFVFLKPAS